jgi:hypothetical protein
MVRPLGMNTSTSDHFETGRVLKNRFLQSAPWVREQAGSYSLLSSIGGTITEDANGWQVLGLGERAGTVMHRDLQVAGIDSAALYPPGSYICNYTGEGRLILGMDAFPLEMESNNLWAKPQSPGRILFNVPQSTNSGIYFGVDEENPSNRIRNVQIYPAQYDGTLASNPWDPDALADQAPFSLQRVMNWQRINYHPNGVWANRATLNSCRYTTRKGMPLELCIDWANRLTQTLWICIPHKANNAYVEAMADLVNALLNPQLDIVVEISNEIWNNLFNFNPGFPDWDPSDGQGAYFEALGISLGLGANPYESRLHMYARRAKEVLTLFKSRLSNPARFKGVIAGHHEGDNENNNKLLTFEDAKSAAHIFATAPYWGDQATGALGNAQNMIDDMATKLAGPPLQQLALHKARATANGLLYWTYEGGAGPIPTNSSQVVIAKNALYDQQMAAQYKTFFDECIAVGVDLVVLYSMWTKYGVNGCFGHLRSVGEQPRPPRYVALVDYAQQTTTQPQGPGSDAMVEALVGWDSSNTRYGWFAGPGEKAVLPGTVIDFLGPIYRTKTLTQDTTFTVANALRGARMVLELEGNYKVKWPASFRVLRGRYDGSAGQLNRVQIYVQEHQGSQVFEVVIDTMPKSAVGLLLRQNLVLNDPSTLFGPWSEIKDSPSANPATANRFSALGRIGEYLGRGGFLNLKLVWPLVTGTDGQPLFLAFRQLSSPLEFAARDKVLGYELGAHNLINANAYAGISRASVNQAYFTLIPGNSSLSNPFVALSRHGLGVLLTGGVNLMPTPNLTFTSRIELYAEAG